MNFTKKEIDDLFSENKNNLVLLSETLFSYFVELNWFTIDKIHGNSNGANRITYIAKKNLLCNYFIERYHELGSPEELAKTLAYVTTIM